MSFSVNLFFKQVLKPNGGKFICYITYNYNKNDKLTNTFRGTLSVSTVYTDLQQIK